MLPADINCESRFYRGGTSTRGVTLKFPTNFLQATRQSLDKQQSSSSSKQKGRRKSKGSTKKPVQKPQLK